MRILNYAMLAGLMVLAPCGSVARAQQTGDPQTQGSPQQSQPQSAPVQAYHPPLAGIGNANQSEQEEGGEALTPDNRSLAGAESLSLGAPKTGYHFWTPYVDVSATLASNPFSASGSGGWTAWTSIYGGVDVHRTSGNSDFSLSYLGGESISSSSGIDNSTIQQLGFADRITFRRSSVMLLDQLGYLPESSFGYAGVGGPDLQFGGTIGLQNSFVPNQSILTGLGRRVSNSFVTEVDTFLTPRSTLTLVGSYGILDYFDGLNNSQQATVQGGYSYLLTRKDTIAVLYRFAALRYDHIAQSINDNSIEVSYARRVTGRLAFQVAGGPDVAFSEKPITGSTSSSAVTTNGKKGQVFWYLQSSANYAFRRSSVQLAYTHSVTGGSGVLAGAVTDNVTGYADRQLTRAMSGSWNVGYSRNEGAPITSGSPANQTYDYVYTGVSLNRRLWRSMDLQFGYQANYQTSSTSFCITSDCGTSYVQHQVFVTLGWHPGSRAF
jgi:hypothetical protein